MVLTRPEASITAIVDEAVPAWNDDIADARGTRTLLRRRLTSLMRSNADTILDVLREAMDEAVAQGLFDPAAILSLDATRSGDGFDLTVTTRDGGHARGRLARADKRSEPRRPP